MRTESSRLLNTAETAAFFHRALRTIQAWGAQWERTARACGNSNLPSSPAIGLRRSGADAGRALYDQRDIDEYVENSVREVLGQAPLNWRKDNDHA
jgi:hypothetical protein